MLDRIFAARQTPTPGATRSYILPVRSLAGVNLTEDQARAYSAVWSATKVISETVAVLPWRVFRQDGDRRELQAGNGVDEILHRRANPEMGAFQLKEVLVACALLHGNGYAEIERNRSGVPIALWPLHPRHVEPSRTPNGTLFYRVWGDGTESVDLPAEDVFHLRGPTKDGVTGISVISAARESFGLGIAGEQFASAFFGNGAVPSYVVRETDSSSTKLSPEGANNMLESLAKRHGGPRKAGKPAFLEKGFEIEAIGISQKDAQFIESRKFQVTEVARWFRVPPHKIADMSDATFSNIEQQSIDFVMDAILPWAARMEQEADFKLLSRRDLITKLNVNGLLRGDSAARGEFYQTMWEMGAYSTNDIRRLEDENPVPNGDQRFVPMNFMTLERAAQSGSTDAAGAARAVLIEAHDRMLTKERNAATRANGKKDLAEWARGFYPRHQAQLADTLMHGAMVVGAMYEIDDDRVRGAVDTHVREHVEYSMRDIANGHWDWEGRAERAADTLIGRLAGAAHACQ